MQYKHATMLYWSGTGNSYRVSQWIGTIAGDQAIETQTSSLDIPDINGEQLNNDESFVSLVFPSHGFTAPWHVIKSVWMLPSGRGKHAFCIATRAGLKFGPFFPPGISGSGTFVIAILLFLKGYRVRGLMSVDMPSNWFAFHPIQRDASHEAIITRAERKVRSFMERVLSQSSIWLTPNNLYELFLGTLLLPASTVYLLFGRFFIAKLFFANNNCDGCGLCARKCSVNAISMRGGSRRMPFWKYNCESCMRCGAICPQNAIEAGHSWAVLLYLITAFPVTYLILSYILPEPSSIIGIKESLLGTFFDTLYFYPAIFISYFLFNLLLRVPLINYLFTYTTMTHLSFWGRYKEPNTKLRDLS